MDVFKDDDGLIAIDKDTSWPDITKIKEKMHIYSNKIGFKIELENPAYEINYLDLNLKSSSIHTETKQRNQIYLCKLKPPSHYHKANTKYDWKKH